MERQPALMSILMSPQALPGSATTTLGVAQLTTMSVGAGKSLVGTLNLCLEMPETMQKESAQSDHPTERKHPKHAEILAF